MEYPQNGTYDNPVSVLVDTFNTGKLSDEELSKIVIETFDLRPAAIIKQFDLRNLPAKNGGKFYQKLAAYGHVGREDFSSPWEETQMVEILNQKASLTASV